MELDPSVCYRIVEARDRRFDGRFFTGITTTRTYCRPTCSTRPPQPEEVRFFSRAELAEQAGFRPCKRCRPGAARGTPGWNAAEGKVDAALGLVGNGFLNKHSVGDLARRVGMTERAMRGLFVEHVGFAPNDLAQSRGARSATADTTVTMMLRYRPPFRWEQIIAFLSKRAINGVEEVSDHCYRRSIALGGSAGILEVAAKAGRKDRLRVTLIGIRPESLGHAVRRVRRMFDLDADPTAIGNHLSRDPLLAPFVRADPGMRLPLTWDPFEAVVRAVIGQQISVAGAVTIVGRLAERCGKPLANHGTITRVFPGPSEVARADVSALGMPSRRARTLVEVAKAVLTNKVRLDGFMPTQEVDRELLTLPGIGPWSAQYVALRGLGEPDSFPESDLGIRKALDMLGYPKDRRLRLEAMAQLAPWRGYAAIYLWQTLSGGG